MASRPALWAVATVSALAGAPVFLLPSTRQAPTIPYGDAEVAQELSRQEDVPAASHSDAAPWNGRPFLMGLALGVLATVCVARAPAALAAEFDNGEGVFLGNCAACHAGGNNSVQPELKLKKEALTTFGMYDVEKIKYQVTNGKNAMPAFGERLSSQDIEDVAKYVLGQAEAGWPPQLPPS